MLPCLSQVCSLSAPFGRDLEDYAAGACRGVDVWLTKLEEFLKSNSLDGVRRLLEENELTVPAASYQGGLLTSQGAARREHYAHFEQRLALCRGLSIRTLVLAADVVGPLSSQDLDRVLVSLREASRLAGDHGVRLALEFQASSSFLNNLHTAAAVVAEVGSPWLGLCLDAFHYHLGPSKESDLALLERDNLYHVQLCDLSGTCRELAADGDRILPGDGDIPLAPLVARLQAIGYDGAVSVELLNPAIWQVPPRQFGEIAITALRKVLGLARME